MCATPGWRCDDLLDLVHHRDGAVLRRGVGELDIDDQIALVLIGNEPARNHRCSRNRSGRAGRRKASSTTTLSRRHQPTDAAIEAGRRVEDDS